MEAKEFQLKIKNYAEQYRNWIQPIDAFRVKYIQKHKIRLFDREGTKKLDSAVQEFITKQQAKNTDPTELIFTFLSEEYQAYLNATQEECDAIRASFSINREFENLLLDYVRRATLNLRRTRDTKWLESGLVAASLENSGIDYRDTLLSLNDLYQVAKDVGIDPNPYFQKAVSLASHEKPRGGWEPLNMLLDGYIKKPAPQQKVEPDGMEPGLKIEQEKGKVSLGNIHKRLFKG